MCDGVMWDTVSGWSPTDGGGDIGQSISGLVTIEHTETTWRRGGGGGREGGREGGSERGSE